MISSRSLPILSSLVVSLLAAGALSACATDSQEPQRPATTTTSAPAETQVAPVQDQRAQAASLLMPPARDYADALHKLRAGVGGIFIPSWADPALLGEGGQNLAALRAEVGHDFEVSIDFEGGRVQRFSEILGDYPSPQEMAAHNTPEQVEAIGAEIGTSLHAHGINVDFAPVLDVDGNGLEVVGDRSFSTDPAAAGEYGAAFARGLQSAGVKAVFKHFPGHGRASGDTHVAEAITPPLDQLYGHEFIPFAEAVPAAPEAALMMGHLEVPGLGDGHTAASINPAAYELARDFLHFNGVIYTDDLGGMASITNSLSIEESVVAAIAAGADMPLWSTDEDIDAIIDAVDSAVTSGTIAPETFASAVDRVAAATPN
ncbi:MAG: glycoside hydrolase family 3 N-terminal domain-containing protein [Corynebacterium flavescens]|uniref:glycoside hydrolase family 3 N-terminal domain-containing protein n=1 Tax=Corynebacterium flavescens TaxID=28028 RepID=UPI003F90B767